MTFLTRRRVGDAFYTASRRSTTTRPKPLTDHREAVQTNRQAGNMFPTLPDRTDCFCGPGSRIGIHITLYKPPSPVMYHSFHTSKMTGTHQEQLIDHLRVYLVFIEFNFIVHDIFKTQKTAEPSTCPASITPTPRRRRKPQNPWVLP